MNQNTVSVDGLANLNERRLESSGDGIRDNIGYNNQDSQQIPSGINSNHRNQNINGEVMGENYGEMRGEGRGGAGRAPLDQRINNSGPDDQIFQEPDESSK